MSSNKPGTAYVVENPPEGSDKKAIWHPIGVAFKHNAGDGCDVVLPPGVFVTGRITCRWRTEKDAEAQPS